MILGYDSEKMSCILHEFDAKHASAYIDFWFHKGREHLSPWREFRVCLIHRQLPHSSRDIAHLFFFFYVRRISVSPAGNIFKFQMYCPNLTDATGPMPLYLYCLLEFVHDVSL